MNARATLFAARQHPGIRAVLPVAVRAPQNFKAPQSPQAAQAPAAVLQQQTKELGAYTRESLIQEGLHGNTWRQRLSEPAPALRAGAQQLSSHYAIAAVSERGDSPSLATTA
ncbi:hypothetical protein INR99_01070 [Chitinilyticum litopenaei]|uniref:Uncharacterized protein n=2 Tax=Chitinilyticum piscinae TaxID=2866724 RepID=A0A8J7FF76_9NEIS|nr:hypothetical protein [Chitinilyticum piscinae]